MEQTRIVINRASSMIGCLGKYKLELDGFVVGELKNGGTIEIQVGSGFHTLNFILFGKCVKTININIDANTEIIYINAKINKLSGKLELETNNPQNLSSNIGSNMEPINAKRTRRSNGSQIVLTLVIVFFVVMLFSVISSPSTTPSTIEDNNEDLNQHDDSHEIQQDTLTIDEKADLLLQDASKEFEEGNYIEAVNICDRIVSEYPETTFSKNMSNYLKEQYENFTNISATRLMNEYEANIVNADKEYTQQVLIVDGIVNSIDKTNNGNNLCVLLKTNTNFASVQLNFDTDQEDAVSKLSKGDSIKAIAKCTGKSGKYFLVLDGNNVMIEDCYIIE